MRTCCKCSLWTMGFGNYCIRKALIHDDWSDQPSDQPACKYFNEEVLDEDNNDTRKDS